ncbi:MAG: helix-turn-helix transcriptional regulator, partial [Clostridia bacterium]|nr:helix-turn-helix transcriptional regulator [Clostridia bacterium]
LLVHFRATEEFIHAHATDPMWSCHARSRLISVMCLAESAYQGEQEGDADAVIRYIREHVERPMSVESLCRMFKTNRTTLTKTVKAATGLSPMQFVLEERLNQSRPDLLFTALPIGFIAMKYGFANANYYIRAFRQRFGKSPLQYRNEQIEKWRANKE